MKKLFILGLAALLTLAFGSAYAQQAPAAPTYGIDFKASGTFSLDALWGRNYQGSTYAAPASRNHSLSYTAVRGRLMFQSNLGQSVTGTIYFEMDGNPYGATPGSADPGSGQRNTLTSWTADRAAVEIKWLYFDVAVPVIPVPVTLRIGQQSFGPRFLVFSGDDSGITANIDLSPAKIALYWVKAVEGATFTSDDSDEYGIHANVNLGTVTVGGYGLYYNFNSYPIWVKRSATAGAITVNDYVNGTNLANFWYFGAYADGKMGPATVNFDFVYENGKSRDRHPETADEIKYRGYAAWLRVDYPWDIFNFGFGAFYGSGDDKTNATKKKGFVSPPCSEGTAPFGEAFFYAGTNSSYIGNWGIAFAPIYYTFANAGYGGTWFAKVYAKAQVTPSYNVGARIYYIGDTTKNGDTYGSATSGGVYTNSKTIGWEFDLINTVKVYKNLVFDLNGGVMSLGNAMRYMDAGVAKKYKTPWIIGSDLTYNF